MDITRFVRLVVRIFRHGKFHDSGTDYAQSRREMLAGVGEFSPVTAEKSSAKDWISKSRFLRFWAGQAAFLKDAGKSRAGHLCVPDARLCYIRIPKAASTALSYSMLKACFRELETSSPSPRKINFLADVNLRKTTDSTATDQTFFAVLRNPFSRVVSLYRDAFEHSRDEFIYEDYLFGIFKKEMSFSDFVRTLYLIPDGIKDQHLKPQYALLAFYRSKAINVSIFKLEETAQIQEFLLRFGLRLEEINKSVDTYDYRSYYDEETLEKVYRIYSKDVASYGYAGAYEDLCQFVARRGRAL